MADADPDEREGTTGSVGFLPRLLLWLGVIALALVIVVIVVPIDPWFREATRQSREVDGLFKFMLAASVVIFVYVQGLTLAFALRYRRRRADPADAVGAQMHGHTRLETAWSIAPALLLVVLAVVSLRVLSDENTPQPHELQLAVRAYQYGYAFSLPQYGIKDVAPVTIPVNRPVSVSERSSDVIHSFWVPQFRIQYDAVPGLVTHERFVPTETGSYPVICTQFCGSGHASMNGALSTSWRVIVTNEATFVAWLRQHGATRVPTAGSTAALVPRS